MASDGRRRHQLAFVISPFCSYSSSFPIPSLITLSDDIYRRLNLFIYLKYISTSAQQIIFEWKLRNFFKLIYIFGKNISTPERDRHPAHIAEDSDRRQWLHQSAVQGPQTARQIHRPGYSRRGWVLCYFSCCNLIVFFKASYKRESAELIFEFLAHFWCITQFGHVDYDYQLKKC